MRLRGWILSLFVALSLGAYVLAQPGPSCQTCSGTGGILGRLGGGCGGCGHHWNWCPRHCCPPAYRDCQVGPPHIKVRRGCHMPVCPPCDAPAWGYYQPCWSPWPWPTDWDHCPVPVPAAAFHPHADVVIPAPGPGKLPPPRKSDVKGL